MTLNINFGHKLIDKRAPELNDWHDCAVSIEDIVISDEMKKNIIFIKNDFFVFLAIKWISYKLNQKFVLLFQ